MIAVSDAVELILPFAPGVPEPLIEDAIRTVAEDICRNARVWRFEDEFTMKEGADSLASPASSHILRVLTCTADGVPLISTTERTLDENDPHWRGRKGCPVYFWQRSENEIVLTPVPERPVVIALSMVLTTTVESEFLPETFRLSHRRLLVDGVISELLTMPGKTWTNVEVAIIRNSRFQAGIAEALTRSQRGQQDARFRSKARFV